MKIKQMKIMRMRSKCCVAFLYYSYKIFGLAPFALENNRITRAPLVDIICPILVLAYCVIAGLLYTYFELFIYTDQQSGVRKFGGVMTILCGVLGNVVSIVTIWWKRNNFIEIADLFLKVDEILDNLKIQQNYEKTLKARTIHFAVFVCLTFFMESQISIISLISNSDIEKDMFVFNYFREIIYFLIFHLIIFLFINLVASTLKRYEQLNEVLTNLYTEQENPTNAERLPPDNQQPAISALRMIDIHSISSAGLEPIKSIQEIQKLHNSLLDLIEKILDLLSLSLITVIANYFANILMASYWIYLLKNDVDDFATLLFVCSCSVWLSLSIAELFAIAVVCSQAQKLEHSTSKILHRIWMKHPTVELKDEIQMLSLQLLQRPLAITVFGFLSLDYSLLYKILCATVAYFVIMVQLDSSKTGFADVEIDQNAWNVTTSN